MRHESGADVVFGRDESLVAPVTTGTVTLEELYETALGHARANRFAQARQGFKHLTSRFPSACKCWVSWAQVP